MTSRDYFTVACFNDYCCSAVLYRGSYESTPVFSRYILLHLLISLDSERLNDMRKKSIISQKIIDEKVKVREQKLLLHRENIKYYYAGKKNFQYLPQL